MPRKARWLLAAASVLLLVLYGLPLWRIYLKAPQYPEGLGMQIRISSVVGLTEHDLNNINKLNHYIGMKEINADAIPEMRWMPWLLLTLVVGGLVAAAAGRRRGLMAWLAFFAALSLAGLVDFWRWGYDYGHNLSPDAILVVPGMSYQPPIFGTKQLLNFTASSWPASGAVFAGIAFAMGAWALFLSRGGRAAMSGASKRAMSAAGAAVILGCGAPQAGPFDHAGHGAPEASAAAPVMAPPASRGAAVVEVRPAGPVASLAEALDRVASGGRVVVHAGEYRESTLVVRRPVTIEGRDWPTLAGTGARSILVIASNDVTVRGLRFAGVAPSMVEDPAAIRVVDASNCRIENNRVDNAFFGIYLARASDCVVSGNVVRGSGRSEVTNGNGIHLWSSRGVTIAGNDVRGHRDGIYFEFVHGTRIAGNTSAGNQRYGLHFMYSDDCEYTDNVFAGNGSGVAVMYTRRVVMTGNRFEENWGPAAYGLLLKEIGESRLERNVFTHNTTGLLADGADRLIAGGNLFTRNGWAVKLAASTLDARFSGNEFLGNTFDVATNSSAHTTRFDGNYWDEYRGYDLDRDGVGDVPHHPVRLFSMVIERHPPALVLMRGLFVGLLDAAERVLPALTPETLMDAHPRAGPPAVILSASSVIPSEARDPQSR